jgi:CxxC motif-containing protein
LFKDGRMEKHPGAAGMARDKSLVCICCPRGCRLTVTWEGTAGQSAAPQAIVSGNACPRGAVWGAGEASDPRRVLTAVAPTDDPAHPVLPVRSSAPVPLPLLFPLLELIRNLAVPLPVKAGTCLLDDPLGCGARIVASRSLPPLTAARPSCDDTVSGNG